MSTRGHTLDNRIVFSIPYENYSRYGHQDKRGGCCQTSPPCMSTEVPDLVTGCRPGYGPPFRQRSLTTCFSERAEEYLVASRSTGVYALGDRPEVRQAEEGGPKDRVRRSPETRTPSQAEFHPRGRC